MVRGVNSGTILGEHEFKTIVGRNGHVTIPKPLRDKLKIRKGTILKLKILEIINE